MKKTKILTHDQKFHADEVFAIAILKKIYSNVEIVRSRQIDKVGEVDFIIDMGGEYNFEKKIFDHHQNDFDLKRNNDIPYSSCGLIQKDYGRQLVNSDDAFSYIDRNLIQFIDAGDNGITFSNGVVNIYSIGEAINSFNPIWNSSKSEDALFFDALCFAESVLDREIKKANSILEGDDIVRESLSKVKHNEEFVILPKSGLPKALILQNEDIKFYIHPAGDNNWVSVAVPVEEKSFVRRKYFPKSWAGLRNEELEEVSGVRDAVFCHKEIFIVAGKTKESVVALTKKALDNP